MSKKIIFSAVLTLLLFIEFFLIKSIPLLKETFPLENTEAVLFTLSQNIEGSRDFVIILIAKILREALVLTGIFAIISFLLHLTYVKISRRFCFLKKNIISFNRILCIVNILAASFFAYSAYNQLPLIDYYLILQDISIKPEHSEFYKKEYVDPDSVQIQFNTKQNLILIFLESMEYNFQDTANGGNLQKNLIPEITEFIRNEQSFIPGGTEAWGMGWTIADAVAKTCGIPLTFPPSISNQWKPLEKFIPGATCLTDILIRNGYNFVVSKGANIKYSGMDDFLKSHSSPQAFGLREYETDARAKNDTVLFWGIKDKLHYELIKEHINRLAEQEKPWALWAFTVDTHTPYGYLDPDCAPSNAIPEEQQYPFVIRCTSKQIKSFIDWAKTQKWYNKTTIAVMGDHATMAAPASVGFTDTTITHYWLDFFINSTKKADIYKRHFTSLDFFPTILESIGANIPGQALGLGRSLYSSEPTLLEKYGIDSLNNALKKKSIEYDYFLYFDKK